MLYHTYRKNILKEDIDNTRLVLNIAQVYPARLRKSIITTLH